MKTVYITDYDNVNPLGTLHLAMLSRDVPFTPDYVARLRRTDPRPFPFFAVCAVEGGTVIGQVGVFRLPLISTAGSEDAGGIWAPSVHPEYGGRDLIAPLLDEAHRRMREAGLRFSLLSTSRLQTDYDLYQHNGYVDMRIWATALAPWETAHLPTRLQARPGGPEGYQLVERIFARVATNYLGFARRHSPFTRLRDTVSLDDIWIIRQDQQPIGYALTHKKTPVLIIHDLVLPPDTDVTEAVAALATRQRTAYAQLTVSRRVDRTVLQNAGWQIAYPNWSALMVKPLVPEVTVCDARRLFGIGTDQFLISWLDVT